MEELFTDLTTGGKKLFARKHIPSFYYNLDSVLDFAARKFLSVEETKELLDNCEISYDRWDLEMMLKHRAVECRKYL